MSEEIVGWIAYEILPHEKDVRNWLRKLNLAMGIDIDDLIQEAYCRVSSLRSTAHIHCGRAYFFTVIKNILKDRLRHERIIRIENMAEIHLSTIVDSTPSVEREVGARDLLKMVGDLIDQMPPRRADTLRLRRIEGLSQRQTAERLDITENIVEKELARGLKSILQALKACGLEAELDLKRRVSGDRTRNQF